MIIVYIRTRYLKKVLAGAKLIVEFSVFGSIDFSLQEITEMIGSQCRLHYSLTRRTAAYLCMHGSDAPCIGAVFINPLVESVEITLRHRGSLVYIHLWNRL